MFIRLVRSSELYLVLAIAAILLFAIVQDLPAWQQGHSTDTIRAVVDLTNTGARTLRGERAYVGGELPEVVIDFTREVIQIRLDRVVLNELPFKNSRPDLIGVAPWCPDSNSNSELRISRVHLHRAMPLLDSTKLAVISRAVNSGAEYVQRYLPGEMMLRISDGRQVHIVTDIGGESLSWKENALWNVSEFFGHWTGSARADITMSARDAMALYGISARLPCVSVRCESSARTTTGSVPKR